MFFKGYNGFCGSVCVFVNEELVYGILGECKFNEGDIISLDIGVKFGGYYGDLVWIYGVGKILLEN